ncbi:MAG: divalent-cation tolerance protein CutA [Promethearchaeota archaeon]
MPKFVVALTTCPKEKSEELALRLVEEHACACVNIVTNVKSIYYWKDEIVTDEETLLIMKTHANRMESLWKAIKNLHPYEIPEFIVLPVMWGSKDYLDWISSSVEETK